jgi:cytochrome c-type biogenesis protein
MEFLTVSTGLAFLAGLASFLSPCVFSLVPAYISYLSGRSIQEVANDTGRRKWGTISHGLAFVLGFSVVFISVGIAVALIGGALNTIRFWIARVGGLLVILLGIHMTGLMNIPFLDHELKPRTNFQKNSGYLSSAMMGVFFSAGWSPCVGPVLGSIYTLVLNGGSIGSGGRLLSAYSAGLAIPFLIAAAAIGWVTKILQDHGKVLHSIQIAMGVVLIIIGFMLFMGTFEQMARFGVFINFGL